MKVLLSLLDWRAEQGFSTNRWAWGIFRRRNKSAVWAVEEKEMERDTETKRKREEEEREDREREREKRRKEEEEAEEALAAARARAQEELIHGSSGSS